MSEYKEVLHKWAKEFIKEHRDTSLDVDTIVEVKFQEYEASGYCHTCWDPGYTSIEIKYLDSEGVARMFYETSYGSQEAFKMGNILQELFDIAEEEDVDS